MTDTNELEAARHERHIQAQERQAIAVYFPHIHHDSVFLNALIDEMHQIRSVHSTVTMIEAAAELKANIANKPALNALAPAYEKLLSEIARYNRNPLDNRWIKDTNCWEKFVAAERTKQRIAS